MKIIGSMTIYKAKLSFLLGNLIVLIFPLLLTLVVYLEGEAAQQNEWIGIGIFWIIGALITFIPLGSRLEVGEDYIKTYLFGLTTTQKTQSSDVQALTYGNVFWGGLGFGKGINFRILRNGKSRAHSLSEKVYGPEAITHAKRVLSNKH